MLPIDEALAICLEAALPVRSETVGLDAALDRVLAAEVVSPVDLPPWDNSAMDGFAVRTTDALELQIVETIAAGSVGTRRIEPGTCARIMTGAPVPEGADAIVIREDTTALDADRVRIEEPPRLGNHIRRRGEDVARGQTVLEAGQTLTPARIGLIASLGLDRVRVARKPIVALLSTGDEIAPAGKLLGPGEIYSSNSAALAAMVRQAGGEPLDCGNAPDDLEGTRAAFRRTQGADLIVSTGGVSVGDFDVVREALADEGADMRFWKVRMKPGKPLAFGVIEGRPAFGLPGNPVSCLVNFLQFVRPVLRRSLGDPQPFLPVLSAVLAATLKKRTGREELVRVSLRIDADGGLVAEPTAGQGSHQMLAMSRADGFVLLAHDTTEVLEGTAVPVQLLPSGLLAGAEPGYRWA